ncbi:MAG TPA: L,D-transpeptidase family protein [Nannocystaceae bacterium]|nr:L,D-transpeptidase family protein [Nannocystaceae bacterium]
MHAASTRLTTLRLLTLVAAVGACACERKGEATYAGRGDEPKRGGERAAKSEAVLGDRDPAALPREDMPAPSDEDGPEAPPPDEPAPPVAPADYGRVKPTNPPPSPEALTLQALAGYEVVAVHDLPDGESPRLGYLRIGTRMRVGEKVDGPGCPKGWYPLAQGGYACASKGLQVSADSEPFMKTPPPPARVDEALPYDYAYVKRWNSAMWWRVPTREEIASAEVLRARRETERLAAEAALAGTKPGAKPKEAKPAEAKPAEPKPAEPKPAEPKPESSLPSVDDDDDEDAKPERAPPRMPGSLAPRKDPLDDDTANDEAPAVPAAPAEPVEPAIPLERLPLKPDNPWLERGYFISVGDKISEEGRTFWRTARGGFVDVAHAYKYGAKDFEGVPLGEEVTFPFGFVMAEAAKVYELTADNKLAVAGTIERRTFVDLTEETEIAGKSYMLLADGRLVRTADVRMADPQMLPEGLQQWERWIDVSLDKQLLVAYEGPRPVFTSLVSTGKKGTAEEPFETPTGRWRIRSKHISTTMDGNTASDGNYSIQDVPWAMFFEGSFALHGAFWHQGFGRTRSHGCVNLGPSAARWLFYWTTPFLPEGWHGVHAHAGSPGTTVIVRR